MPIQLLSPEIASQIAAGEVVERPASAVKELIENALDAGATTITIAIQNAGKRLIEVADNGIGIPASELSLAIERHATSKLHRAEDLFHITTLGFRGEALASLGSVSLLTITSRSTESEVGAQLQVEAGIANPVKSTAAPIGTLVRVENLFFNVPARLKFLKSDPTERKLIDTLVTRYALAYPQVRFQLKQENRLSLQTSGNNDRREVLAALYGPDIARQMLEVLADFETIQMRGFISPISLTRSNRQEITFFINGRPVQDIALTTALLQAYHNLLMVGRYPQAILFIEMPPEEVDVNVHPTKAEVRFRNRDEVFSAVQRAVRRALLAHTPIPSFGPPSSLNPTWDQTAQSNLDGTASLVWDDALTGAYDRNSGEGEPGELTENKIVQPEMPAASIPLLRLIGQVAYTYLIAEGPDGLYLIDQHAAHERVLFERLMAQRQEGVVSQTLLQPVTVDLPPANARLLVNQIPILSRFGFQVEEFGLGTFLVRAIPTILAGSDPAAAVRVLVENFEEDETPLQAEIEARLIARVCKRAAVKAGKVLSPEEQKALLMDLEACRSPRTCPHGRPTMIHLSVDLLERQFGRRGAR